MPTDPGPHDLSKIRPILAPDGRAILRPTGPTFYEDLGRDFPDFNGHLLIQTFEFSEKWPTWEMHPEADEFVYLLSGDVDFLLKSPDGGTTRVRVDEPGQFVLVPRGAWHTAEPHEPTSMLFVTAGEGTRNEVEPPV